MATDVPSKTPLVFSREVSLGLLVDDWAGGAETAMDASSEASGADRLVPALVDETVKAVPGSIGLVPERFLEDD